MNTIQPDSSSTDDAISTGGIPFRYCLVYHYTTLSSGRPFDVCQSISIGAFCQEKGTFFKKISLKITIRNVQMTQPNIKYCALFDQQPLVAHDN